MSEIRRVGLDAVDRIAAVAERAFDPRYGECWTAAQLRSGFAMPGYVILELAEEDMCRAFAVIRTVAGESELLLLATDPDHRRQGLAGLLIERWKEEVGGGTRRFLEMRADNPARKLYEHFGFREIGRRPNYYTGADNQLRDAITMEHFVKESLSKFAKSESVARNLET